jgi:hypothetical protein
MDVHWWCGCARERLKVATAKKSANISAEISAEPKILAMLAKTETKPAKNQQI